MQDVSAAGPWERFPGFERSEDWSRVAALYPVRTTTEYLELVREPVDTDPVFRQIAPSFEELGPDGEDDPVGESAFEVVPGLLHRFPDRALILVTPNCFVHCRHCMRKRMWNAAGKTDLRLAEWARYVREHDEIREAVLSGGDPLTLGGEQLEKVLRGFAGISHVRNLRVHTRALVAAPSRITPELVRLFSANKVTRLVTQFNHPAELGPAARSTARLLAGGGIMVENQSVLLAGVNDRAEILAELFKELSAAGIRPYYLHHPDPVRGAMHFSISMEAGLAIYRQARRLAGETPAPQYVVDLPGAAGKMSVENLIAKVI